MVDESLIKTFWKWFLEHEELFFYYEKYQDKLLPIALDHLQEIQGDLVFEVGPEIEGKRELIISANGMKEGFSSVIEVVKSSPDMERWTVIPFRQRKENLDLQIQMNELVLSPEDIFFSYEMQNGKIDLHLYIAGINPEDEDVYQVVLLILDNVIGEYDVEMKLGDIDIFPLQDVKDPKELLLLKDLPPIIDLANHQTIN
jgi:hypothetical protein